MSIPQRLASHGTFFISTQTHERRSLFQSDRNCELLFKTLKRYRREGHYKLHAFVIMPDHIHLLLTTQGTTLERAMQLIKGGFSRKIESKFPVWQKGFTDRRMRNEADFLTHKGYIHHTPVRARLCQHPEDHRWSSAYRQSHLSG